MYRRHNLLMDISCMKANHPEFTRRLLDWAAVHGRKNLPWQINPDPYRVWVSEIMLQQTQVETVIPYYQRFMQRFPDLQTLALAGVDEVLQHWSGLGYYARARNLHKTAGIIHQEYAGSFPDDLDSLQSLPGIGRSTAAAILSLAMQKSHAILDGNVKRVLARCYAVDGWPGNSSVLQQLWKLSEQVTPGNAEVALFNQGMMDLGATLCSRSRPDCERCPVADICMARLQNRQAEFPGKKLSKTLPVKQRLFALLHDNEGRVMLEKRPPAGIWGGLWSFPEFSLESRQALTETIRQSLGMKVDILEQLPPRRHTFSHYHLEMFPIACRIDDYTECHDRSVKWVDRLSVQKIGLAAPVEKLLWEFFEKSGENCDSNG
jgi:A/G-specific adenine glycosylase